MEQKQHLRWPESTTKMALSPPPYLFSTFASDDRVAGKTYGEWTAKWWQCYLWSEKKRNKEPVYMIPGKLMETKSEEKIECRICEIESHKPILMTVINWVSMDKNFDKTEEQLREVAKTKMSEITEARFTLYSKEREPVEIGNRVQRIESPKFKLAYCDAVSHGYWFFFKPYAFPPGEYMINSFGCCSLGKTKVVIDYKLTIVEPKK